MHFEAWTLPWSADFKRVIAKLPVTEGKGRGEVRFSDTGGQGSIELAMSNDPEALGPGGFDRFDQLISATVGRLIRVYNGTTLIDEWLAERVRRDHSSDELVATVSGPSIKDVFDRILVYPFDYPANPTVSPNHIWGGVNLLQASLSDKGEVVEVWTSTPGTPFTLTFDGQTTGSISGSASASTVETAVEALSNVQDVLVTGTGTETDPWVIVFVDPIGPVADMTGTGGSLTVTVTEQGSTLPSGWTVAQRLDRGGTVIFGRHASDSPRVRTDVVDSAEGATWSYWFNGLDIPFTGVQTLVQNVRPGATYHGRLRFHPVTGTDEWRLIIRGRNEQPIAGFPSITTSATGTGGAWNTWTIPAFIMPEGITEVIYRFSSTISNPDPVYLNIQTGTWLREGEPASKLGVIINSLMDDAAVDHAADFRGTPADWIDYSTITDTLDSSGASWVEDISITVPRGASLGQTWDKLVELENEWDLVAKATPSGGKTHDLKWWIAGNGGTPSSGERAINSGPNTPDGAVVRRIPDYTHVLVEGAAGNWVESQDATAKGNFGHLERYAGQRTVESTSTLAAAARQLLAEEAANRVAVDLEVIAHPDQPRPLVDYRPGDYRLLQIPPLLAKVERRIRTIAYTNTVPERYRIVASKIFEGEQGAAEVLRKLVRRFQALDLPFQAGTGLGSLGASRLNAYSFTGNVFVESGRLRFRFPVIGTILGVMANVHVAPTGADIIVDVHKNGTTIFTDQTRRPRIVAGTNASSEEIPAAGTFLPDDYITVDIDQVGSTIPGGDLVVVVHWAESSQTS